VQYLVIPYADFRVGSLGTGHNFSFGPFELWHDTAENSSKYLGCARPTDAAFVSKADRCEKSFFFSYLRG